MVNCDCINRADAYFVQHITQQQWSRADCTEVFVPTKEQHTRPHSFNQLIWVFRRMIGQTLCA